MNLKILLTLICALVFPTAVSAQVYQAHTEVELVTDAAAVTPGSPFWVGLRMKMDPEWHVYWKNPGDSGLAPLIRWKLPEGFTAGDIQWPYPHRINIGPLTSFGYEGEVILWSQITPPRNSLLPSASAVISADVDWLTCKVECVPGKAKLMLLLPASPTIQKNMDVSAELERSRPLWPMPDTENPWWAFRASDTGENFLLEFWTSRNAKMVPENVVFFPSSDKLIAHAAPQEFRQTSTGQYTLTLSKSSLITKPPNAIQGILVQDYGWDEQGKYRSMEINVPFESNHPGIVQSSQGSQNVTLLLACIFAFIGGIILNFMPCVLPVLSLKIVGLVRSVQDRKRIFVSGLIFTVGVVVSFWILAGLLIALQSAGHQLGWGFQFQSPVFVAVMAVILFILGVNLLGVFEIGTSLAGMGQAAPSSGYLGSFMSGVLATVVATPCTAPFMGTAISFALTQPALVAFLVFTFLALGMASPYLLLCAFPKALRFVPKPGNWMLVMKAVFGCILFACVIWLAWVLGLQKGINAVIVLAVGLGLLMIGLRLWGLKQQGKSGSRKALLIWIFTISGLLVAVLGPSMTAPSNAIGIGSETINQSRGDGIPWKDFSPEILAQLRAEKKPVLIDFTAAWCLTCQVNDRLVFQNKKVVEAFQDLGIIGLKADWTNHSEVISKALVGYGKNSIPVYVLYNGQSDDPVLLPELITPDLVIKTLHQYISKK